jgi:hypothetical protein
LKSSEKTLTPTTKKLIGHTYKLNGLWTRCRFTLETVDYKNLKSVNYFVKFYYTGDPEYYHTVVKTMYNATKRIVDNQLDGVIFRKDFISHPNIPTQAMTNATFTEFEFTIYPTGKLKSNTAIEFIFTTLSDKIHKELFKDNFLVRAHK